MLLLVQIVRVPTEGIVTFQRYEASVLPLLPKHGGRFERRLRGDDGRIEVHVVSFPSYEELEAYRSDPERQRLLPLLEESGAETELIEVTEVGL
jgi:uncharacterized protein (DUF1330 family)